ncbi:hypothetical protein J2Y55_005478 [Bosea sp. BE125]|uniref:hypothetical protein n=1 Tax=Bosea sp. BE125 TaxID=2817909 RepID=UPI0028654774|nr:hypothetical protein [Bosea sp. BE125]MDR6874444.1 hypothetical protein [Bosea sp. BE125]
MRLWVVAGLMALAGAASAQDGARVVTLATIKGHRAAGEFIRVENVTIVRFSTSKGGVASDATGSVRFDDIGMPPRTISHLERYCSGAHTGQDRGECRGALEFTINPRDGDHGSFTISDVDFIPQG